MRLILPEHKKYKIIAAVLLIITLVLFGVIAYSLTRSMSGDKSAATSKGRQPAAPGPQPPQKAVQGKGADAPLFPGHRLVALYGTPGVPALGVLGEQPVEGSIARAKDLVANYQSFSDEKILPAMEIITTVASGTPTENGDYSQEVDSSTLKPWIEAAQKAGVYVVLDLQPGRADFVSQAKQYEDLLQYPNVGLALDPEWRLAPDQLPLAQIGSVSIQEVNATADWLAVMTRQHKLPQKLFLLHQFRLSMIADRQSLDATHKELAYVIQMDGQGNQHVKQDTWRAITADAPANVRFGWKNFYDEDSPLLSPQETMAVNPKPWYVSYQ